MIELVIVYCLSAAPDRCVERRTEMENSGPMACTMTAQTLAQQYLATHPAYRMSGWRCGPPQEPA